MIEIEGKQYTANEVAACFRYWKKYMDEQEIKDALITIDPDSIEGKWLADPDNKEKALRKSLDCLDEWADFQDEMLAYQDATIDCLVCKLVYELARKDG